MLNMAKTFVPASFINKGDFFSAYELSTLPPCFMDDQSEDNSVSPSDDIWKKFELPTPPRSPGRDSPISSAAADDMAPTTVATSKLGDDYDDLLNDENFIAFRDFLEKELDDDIDLNSLNSFLFTADEDDDEYSDDNNIVSTTFKNELLHDCMWSGQCNEEHRRSMMSLSPPMMLFSPQYMSNRTDSRCSTDSSNSSCSSSSSSSSSLSSSSPCTTPIPCIPVIAPLSPLSSICAGSPPNQTYDLSSSPPITVDPAAVFPYPLSDHSYYHAIGKQIVVVSAITPQPNSAAATVNQTEAASISTPTKEQNLGIQTPSDSEEEIDVVTVVDKQQQSKYQKRQLRQKSVGGADGKSGGRRRRRRSLPSNPSPQVQRQLQLAVAMATKGTAQATSQMKNAHHHHHHNSGSNFRYSVKRGTVTPPTPPPSNASPRKRARMEGKGRNHYYQKETAAKKAGRWSCVATSRQSSDSEDIGKRKEHNDLERKRRNDLKFSFQTLRKYVPDLQNNDRAPKVLILRKASEHIRQLTATYSHLDRIHRNETSRRVELMRKLQILQRRR